MSSSQGFEQGPSIVELFYSAKKLLSLQPRVENRHLRKDNSKTQRQILASSNGGFHKNHESNNRNKVLDLLSPLSLDDLKNSPPYTQKSPTVASTTEPTTKTSFTLDSSVTRRASVNSRSNVVTPTSMQNDSSPRPSESKRSSISSTKHNEDTKVAAKNTIRSNLTSSLKSETNQTNQTTANPVKPTECHNCHTLKTPLWRKDPQGNTLCNACGLFLKLHGTTRPLSLKTDVIKKRSSKRVSAVNPKQPSSIPMSLSSPGSHSSSLSRSNSFSSRISIAPSDPNVNRIKFNPTYTGGSVNIMAGTSNPAAGQQSSANSRLKNVLILPKPAAGTTQNGQTNGSPFSASSSTPNTPGGSFNSRSIPIPNGSRISPSPPYNTSASYSFGKQSSHPFKRKKSEINIASRDFYDHSSSNPSSFVKRGVSSAGLSNSFNEYNENHVSTVRNSSYSSSSLNRRASEKNFTHMQQTSRNNSAVSNSLTSSNMSIFNQRFTNSNNTYFDTAPGQLSRHNSTSTLMMNNLGNHDEYVETPAANIASTPTSVTSQSSFAIQAGHRPSKANSEWLSRSNKGPMFTAGAQSDASSSIPATPSNDMMAPHGMDTHMDEILHTTDINMRLETDQSFFNKYTSIEGFANGDRSRASSTTGASPKTANGVATEGFTQAQSSLTQGLKSQLENHNNINNDAKDLEWLKFEL